ncbi:16358_t:CDS:2 [Funneliformis caledonium]|uniref:16358_t:CDS:1 n=1 Tax=Funneliformis caledonium TaxID=1117310 RepID=A0A9N9GLJ8_9GLOM|nr:16358_t:CDS:2 [Funneliformis caledonium]
MTKTKTSMSTNGRTSLQKPTTRSSTIKKQTAVESDSRSNLTEIARPKRGRKPKNTIVSATVNLSETANETANETTVPKRGRKRKATVIEDNITAEQATGSDQKTNEKVIEEKPSKRGRKNKELTAQTESVKEPAITNKEEAPDLCDKTDTENNDVDVAEPKNAPKPEKPLVEKRLARFRHVCPAPIHDRIYRAESQRMYMVSRSTIDELKQEFAILGSTGNIFVYLRVLRLKRESPYIYQKALLSEELLSIFANAAPDPTILASQKVREHYKVLTTGESSQSSAESSTDEKRRPIEGDCPICYEPLEEKDRDNIVWCQEGCGNNLHKDCFEQWKKSKRGGSGKVTCVYCRGEWVEDSTASENGLVNEEGYVNFGGIQGMSNIRGKTSNTLQPTTNLIDFCGDLGIKSQIISLAK